MDLDETDGTCSCRGDGMMFTADQSECYDGIDMDFDDEYDCSGSVEEDVAKLTLDISIAFGTTGNSPSILRPSGSVYNL